MRASLPLLLALFCVLYASAALSTTYHVDPAGNDTAVGNEAWPWRTIQHAANQVVGGDMVMVHPGTYRESVVISASGALDSPIVFDGQAGAVLESPDPSASLSAFDVQRGVGHLVLRGFEARGGFHETILIRKSAHDVDVVDCNLHGNRVGIWIAGAVDVSVHGCHIHHNTVHGLRVAGTSRDVTVSRTTSEANDDGLGCAGDADGFIVEETSANVTFVACRAVANGEDGFDLQGDVIRLLGVESRDNACSGVKLYQNARVENSVVAGNTTGISTAPVFASSVQIDIRNSTIFDNAGTQILLRGSQSSASEGPLYSVSLRNIIASGPGKAVEALSPVHLTEDHNIFFRPDTTSGLLVRHFPDGSERRYTGQEINQGVWKAESGQGQGTFAIEPLFQEGESYGAAALEVVIDAGSLDDAPDFDRSGNPRPAGMGVDIGPDEHPVAISNHRPWADPGADRIVVAGKTLHLSAYGSTDPDGDVLGFEWDFGDGSEPQTGYDAWHVYAEPGEYLATLTVSDGSLEHSRSVLVQVVPRSTPTATPTPTSTPPPVVTAKPSIHDSEVRLLERRNRIRLRVTDRRRSRKVRVVVTNADVDPVREDPGHEIRVSLEVVGCPPGVTIGAPDFSRSTPGTQDQLMVHGGHRKRAVALLAVDSGALGTATSRRSRQCVLRVTAIGPGVDPTPENNVAEIPIDVIDSTRL
jgi:hypothetical protein